MKDIEKKHPKIIPINKEINDLTESLKSATDYEPILKRIMELLKQRTDVINNNTIILKYGN